MFKFILIVSGFLQQPGDLPRVFDSQVECDKAAAEIVKKARRNEYVVYTCQPVEVGKTI